MGRVNVIELDRIGQLHAEKAMLEQRLAEVQRAAPPAVVALPADMAIRVTELPPRRRWLHTVVRDDLGNIVSLITEPLED